MALDQPRAAVVGGGLMGRWHAEAAARAGATISAIVDRDAARASELAARFRGCRAVSMLDQALAASDVVHVCTPTASHAAIAGEALRAGRHVLLEKPVAATVAQTVELVAEAGARNLLLCPTHQFVFQRGMRRAIDQILSLGSLRDVAFTTCSAGATEPALEDTIADEILPHPLSIFQRLFRSEVAAFDWTVRRPAAGEIRATAQCGQAGVSITISMGGRPTSNGVVVIGTHGTFEVDLFHGFAVRHGGAVSRTRKAAQPFIRSAAVGGAAGLNLVTRALVAHTAYPGLWELVGEFYHAIRTGGPSPISPADTVDVARAVERLRSVNAIPSA